MLLLTDVDSERLTRYRTMVLTDSETLTRYIGMYVVCAVFFGEGDRGESEGEARGPREV